MSRPPNAPSPWLLLDTDEVRAEVARLNKESSRAMVSVWVLLVGAVAYSAVAVALFAVDKGVPWQTAWALDPLFAVGLVVIVQADSVLARHGRHPGAWVATVRVFCGLTTLTLNVWSSAAKQDAGRVLAHAVVPLLLVGLAEAVPRIRRHYAALIKELLAELRQRETRQATDTQESAAAQMAERDRRAAAAEAARRQQVEEQAAERREQLELERRRLDVAAAAEATRAAEVRESAETERARLAAQASEARAAADRAQAEADVAAAARAGALGGAPKSAPKSTPKSTVKSTRKSTAAGGAESAPDDLLGRARTFCAEHLEQEGALPSQRRLKAALGVGFERAAEIQRLLAAESSPAEDGPAEAGASA